jgi:hypothetical protein
MIGLDSSSVGGNGRTTMSEMRWRRLFVAVGEAYPSHVSKLRVT